MCQWEATIVILEIFGNGVSFKHIFLVYNRYLNLVFCFLCHSFHNQNPGRRDHVVSLSFKNVSIWNTL